MVNVDARFVVLNFPVGQMPVVGRRLNVYRNGLKVGELSVTGPQKEDNTVADITALTAVDFMKVPKLAVPDELVNLRRWHKEVSARPSAAA